MHMKAQTDEKERTFNGVSLLVIAAAVACSSERAMQEFRANSTLGRILEIITRAIEAAVGVAGVASNRTLLQR